MTQLHGPALFRTPLLAALTSVVLATLVACASPASPTATRSPAATAATPPATSARPTVAATVQATSTTIPVTPAAAPVTPAALGARVSVMLDVAPQFRSGRLAEPRTLTLPAGFTANVFAAGL